MTCEPMTGIGNTTSRQICRKTGHPWLSATLFAALCYVPQSLAQEAFDYDAKPDTTIWQDLYKFAYEFLWPYVPGAILLFVLSALFGSINFYKDIPSIQSRRGHRISRYLFAWIAANFTFALVFLLLILPDDVSLSAVNRTLFVYCLIATALPEVATNVKLSLGKADQNLDLYRYKEQLTGIISDRVRNLYDEYRSQQLVNLSYYYYDRVPSFLAKLAVFENQAHLSEEETKSLSHLRDRLTGEPVAGRARKVLELQQEHMILVPKLLAFFENDIRKFENSPVALLLRRLAPNLKIEEARNLVAAGITTTAWFVLFGHFPRYRDRLARRTGIDRRKIDMMYHTSRFGLRRRVRERVALIGSALMVVAIAVSLFWGHEYFTPKQDELADTDSVVAETPASQGESDLLILERDLTIAGSYTETVDEEIPNERPER